MLPKADAALRQADEVEWGYSLQESDAAATVLLNSCVAGPKVMPFGFTLPTTAKHEIDGHFARRRYVDHRVIGRGPRAMRPTR